MPGNQARLHDPELLLVRLWDQQNFEWDFIYSATPVSDNE